MISVISAGSDCGGGGGTPADETRRRLERGGAADCRESAVAGFVVAGLGIGWTTGRSGSIGEKAKSATKAWLHLVHLIRLATKLIGILILPLHPGQRQRMRLSIDKKLLVKLARLPNARS